MKRTRLFLISALCLFTVYAYSQAHRLGGVRFEDEKYITLPLKSAQRSSEPGSAKSLRDAMQIVPLDQGHVPACACYAIAHSFAVQRKLHFDFKCPPPNPLEAFSASYLYNQTCADKNCEKGVFMSVALDTFLRQGICPAGVFPNDRYGCDALPSSQHRQAAARYRIWKYKRVFEIESECRAAPRCLQSFKNELVQTAIAEIDQENPIIVVLEVTEDFSDCPDGAHWAPPREINSGRGHALVLMGYDDGRREFELLNSFGLEWCDGGFVHMSYDDFARTVRYGFVLFLDGAVMGCAGR